MNNHVARNIEVIADLQPPRWRDPLSTSRDGRIKAKSFVNTGLQVLESGKGSGVWVRVLLEQNVKLFLECLGHIWVDS